MSISDYDCVILCGGLGKRLQGVVNDVPKVMADVGGRPFLDHVLEYLKSQGIKRIVLCTGYKADIIENHYSKHDVGLNIAFSTEKEPLGTGGAVKNARNIISSDPFFVLNGDSYLSTDLQAFFGFHNERESLASICVAQVGDQNDFGSIALTEDGLIISFEEKLKGKPNQLVSAGIYCFSQNIFSLMPDSNAFSLEKDLFPSLAGNKFYGHQIDEAFLDIGTPKRYETVKQKFKKGFNED